MRLPMAVHSLINLARIRNTFMLHCQNQLLSTPPESLTSLAGLARCGVQSIPLCQYIQVRHAGHAKWQNIMHTKSANDAKKSAIRLKCGNQIRLAIREGGSNDPKINKKLADMIDIARDNQIPSDIIHRLMTDNKADKDLKIIPCAIKGPGQSVIIVECETKNLNHNRQMLMAVVKKLQFTVADMASVMFGFQHIGIILCSEYNGKPITDDHLESAMAHALEIGATDVNLRESEEDDSGTLLEFSTDPSPNTFYPVVSALKSLNYKVTYSQLEYIAQNPVELSDTELEQVSVLFEKLRGQPQIVRVFDNIA